MAKPTEKTHFLQGQGSSCKLFFATKSSLLCSLGNLNFLEPGASKANMEQLSRFDPCAWVGSLAQDGIDLLYLDEPLIRRGDIYLVLRNDDTIVLLYGVCRGFETSETIVLVQILAVI